MNKTTPVFTILGQSFHTHRAEAQLPEMHQAAEWTSLSDYQDFVKSHGVKLPDGSIATSYTWRNTPVVNNRHFGVIVFTLNHDEETISISRMPF